MVQQNIPLFKNKKTPNPPHKSLRAHSPHTHPATRGFHTSSPPHQPTSPSTPEPQHGIHIIHTHTNTYLAPYPFMIAQATFQFF